MYPGHPYFEVHHSGPGAFGWLLMVLLAILLAALIGLVVQHLLERRAAASAQAVAPASQEDALALVRLRYARGEIDRETYLQTTADLSGVTAASG